MLIIISAKEATLQILRRVELAAKDDYVKSLVVYTHGPSAIGAVKAQLPSFSVLG